MLAGENDQRVRASRFVGSYPLVLRFGALGLLALMAIASLFVAGPQIEVDEGSYLLSAATLLGKLSTSGVNSYYTGYSLLVLPAFVAGPDPTRIYHAVLLINALLVATTPFALFRLTRLLYPEIAPTWHARTAIAATCYASLLLMSQHAMSESALVPLYAWLLAIGAEAVIDARKSRAIICGALAGLLFLVHPRGGLMAAAVLVALSIFGIRQKRLRGSVVALWLAVVCIAALHAPLESLAGKPAALGSAYNADQLLLRLLRPSTWPWIAWNGFGALTEALVSSLGTVAIGLAALAASLRAALSDRDAMTPRAAVVLAIALGFAMALAMSATFFVPATRADQLAYGRYALPATIPLVALGLLRLTLGTPSRLRDALFAISAGLASIALMGFEFTRLPATTTSVWNYINAPLLYIAQDALHFLDDTRGSWSEIGICFLGASALLYVAAIASRGAGIAAYAALNVAIAALCWGTVTWPNAHKDAANRDVATAANAFESVTGTRLCAELSNELKSDLWIAIDMRWRALNGLSDANRRPDRPCAAASIEALPLAPLDQVEGLIAIERRLPLMQGSVGLVVEPGAALETWKARQPAVARELLAPLPESERRAGIELLPHSDAPSRVRTGGMLSLDVRVTNAGVSRTWPTSDAGPYPILLGARSFLGDDSKALGEYRVTFATPLAPNGSATSHIDVGPFPHAGTYRVLVGVVQELVAWFPETKEVVVEVSDR